MMVFRVGTRLIVIPQADMRSRDITDRFQIILVKDTAGIVENRLTVLDGL